MSLDIERLKTSTIFFFQSCWFCEKNIGEFHQQRDQHNYKYLNCVQELTVLDLRLVGYDLFIFLLFLLIIYRSSTSVNK